MNAIAAPVNALPQSANTNLVAIIAFVRAVVASIRTVVANG